MLYRVIIMPYACDAAPGVAFIQIVQLVYLRHCRRYLLICRPLAPPLAGLTVLYSLVKFKTNSVDCF